MADNTAFAPTLLAVQIVADVMLPILVKLFALWYMQGEKFKVARKIEIS